MKNLGYSFIPERRAESSVLAHRRKVANEESIIPRFFFDYRQARDYSRDSAGIVLGSVEEAYLEAFKGARDIWSELLGQRLDPRGCAFEVRSETGEELFILPFTEILESCLDLAAEPRVSFAEIAETRNFARRVSQEFAKEIQVTRQVLQDAYRLLRRANQLELDQAKLQAECLEKTASAPKERRQSS